MNYGAKKRLFLSGFAIAFTTMLPNAAMAESTKEWSMIAMACTPTHTTAEQRRYVTTGGKIKFKDGASGTISFICPISETLKNGSYHVQGHFAWPSSKFGKGNSLQLRTMDKRTGAVSTVLNATTAIDGRNTKWGTLLSKNKLVGFGNEHQDYWVQFSLSRPTGKGESPSFSSVSLIKR